jgi:hypothetical protein
MQRFLLALAFAVAFIPGARAAHPLITEDTGTQGKGRWQLEVFGEEGRDRTTSARLKEYGAVLSYGIVEAADLQIGMPWIAGGARGNGDASLDLKWRFFEKDALSLGLKPGVTLPTGDEGEGRGTGRVTWGSLIILSYEPGPLALHAHAGYRRNENKLGERESLRQLAGAATYRLGAVRLIADFARETSPVHGGSTIRYKTLGAIWAVTKDFDLDAGWRTGHGGAAVDDVFLLGATWRW